MLSVDSKNRLCVGPPPISVVIRLPCVKLSGDDSQAMLTNGFDPPTKHTHTHLQQPQKSA